MQQPARQELDLKVGFTPPNTVRYMLMRRVGTPDRDTPHFCSQHMREDKGGPEGQRGERRFDVGSIAAFPNFWTMDADMNAFGGIFVGPVRRRLSPDDEFFDLGNVQSYRALKSKMSVFALACGSEEMGWNDDLHLHERSYECMFEGCIAKFSSLSRVSFA